MRAHELYAGLVVEMSQNAAARMGAAVHRITQPEFLKIKSKLDPILKKAGVIPPGWEEAWTMGSAGSWDPKHPYYDPNSKKMDAGDVDVMLDAESLAAAFPAKTLRDSKVLFAKYLEDLGILNNGAALNTVVPVGGKDFQVDLIVKPNAPSAIRGHQMDYAADPTMRGSDLWGQNPDNSIWHTLIKTTANPLSGKVTLGTDKTGKNISALQLSPDYGVVDRETGKVLIPWSEKDDIAKLMIGPRATAKDMSSRTALRAALQAVPDRWNQVKHLFAGTV
jgi:hypothetical protein